MAVAGECRRSWLPSISCWELADIVADASDHAAWTLCRVLHRDNREELNETFANDHSRHCTIYPDNPDQFVLRGNREKVTAIQFTFNENAMAIYEQVILGAEKQPPDQAALCTSVR